MSKKGKPTKYSPELAKRICDLVASHSCGISKLCEMYEELPNPDSVFVWRARYPEFAEQYAQAKVKQIDFLIEEILDISDNSTQDSNINKFGDPVCNTEYIARSRLRVDTRKWLASKLLPKQYGDRQLLEQKTEENESLIKEMRELRAELDKKNKREY